MFHCCFPSLWLRVKTRQQLRDPIVSKLTKAQTGGLSLFSPRFGLVCSNILSYDIVLASGTTMIASESTNPDLRRALEGGSNNFGIVTQFKARTFPSTKTWSGFLYMPAFQANKVLAAFHECVGSKSSDDAPAQYDDHAAGPIACFSYIQKLRLQAILVNLVYTRCSENKKWPACWRNSPFNSIWRLWSTCKGRTLTSATNKINALSPPGRRQVFATTTTKNGFATLTAVHDIYCDAMAPLRRVNVKGLVWTLVLQPLLPGWVCKGDGNSQGLLQSTHEPLVIVSFTVNWDEKKNDEFINVTTRRVIEQMEAVVSANKTDHRYRYLNYCAEWQKPFAGYGAENQRFLREMSRRYDP